MKWKYQHLLRSWFGQVSKDENVPNSLIDKHDKQI